MPATQGMLMAVRDELKHEIAASEKRTLTRVEEVRGELGARIDAVRNELGARIDTVHSELGARIDAVHSELGARIDAVRNELGARIDALTVRVDRIDANVQELRVSVSRLEAAVEKLHAVTMRGLALNEQQDARNAIVLEAVTGMIDRQNRIEKRQDEQEELLRLLIRGPRAPGA